MGNCQAAEAATVVIQHPGNSKIERIYWSVSANEVMTSNPGHYVAMVVTPSTPTTTTTTTTTTNTNNTKSDNGAAASPPLKQLKLLRPDDTLLIGHVYRLISFEDVLKEFAAKRCVKLGRLLERGGLGLDTMRKGESGGSNPSPKSDRNCNTNNKPIKHHEVPGHLSVGSSGGGSNSSRGMGRLQYGGQWRPALQSIAEFGT